MVLIITPRYLPLLGGMERQVELLASAFPGEGWNVRVVTELLDESPRCEFRDGVDVRRVGAQRNRHDPLEGSRGAREQIRSAVGVAWQVIRARRARAIMVRTFTLPAVVVGCMKRFRIVSATTVVTAETGGELDDPSRFAAARGQRFLRWALTGNDYFNALVSSNVRTIMALGIDESRIARIPNGINLKEWAAAEPATRVESFLFVGRLHREKGVYELLDAFAEVADQRDDLALAFAGEGPERDVLEQQIRDRGLADRVSVLGFQQYEGLPMLVRQYDCLVLPSYSEALPLSVLEAAAAGRQLLLSDVGDLRAIFGDTASFVPPRDTDALARAMAILLDRSDASRAAMRVGGYDRRVVCRRYVDLFEGASLPSSTSVAIAHDPAVPEGAET